MTKKANLLEKLDRSLEKGHSVQAVVPPAPKATSTALTSVRGSSLKARAEQLVYRAVPWSVGAGLIPVPLVDVAAASAIQLKLVRDLSQLYGIPFREHAVMAILGSTAASGFALGLAQGPMLGPILGPVAMPLLAGAATLAIGKVFIAHFENQGSLVDLDPADFKAQFAREMAGVGGGFKQVGQWTGKAGNNLKQVARDFVAELKP